MLTKTTMRKTMLNVDQNDQRITDNESLLKTWTEYCDKLYNYSIAPNESLINLIPMKILKITFQYCYKLGYRKFNL